MVAEMVVDRDDLMAERCAARDDVRWCDGSDGVVAEMMRWQRWCDGSDDVVAEMIWWQW